MNSWPKIFWNLDERYNNLQITQIKNYLHKLLKRPNIVCPALREEIDEHKLIEHHILYTNSGKLLSYCLINTGVEK